MPGRSQLLGAPSTYCISVRCVLDQPLFAAEADRDDALTVIEQVRDGYDAALFAWCLAPAALHLVLHLPERLPVDDAWLRQRWQRAGGGSTIPADRLRRRLTDLGGCMQTLLQRMSRARNRRHASRGAIWAGRYRACLVADDAALLAAIAFIEGDLAPTAVASSRDGRGPRVANPPLRVGPDGKWYPADECPPGLPPPAADDRQAWIARIAAELGPEHRRAYGEALAHGWALGRPESLTGPLARLSRGPGRGRSRTLRHLADDLGLCGVWG